MDFYCVYIKEAHPEDGWQVPANYDDEIRLVTRTVRAKGVRIEHHYEVFCGDQTLAEGRTVVASVNPQGKPQPLPAWLRLSP